MQRAVGFACAVLAVVMVAFSIWVSQAEGGDDGLVALGLCLVLLLVAAGTLRTRI